MQVPDERIRPERSPNPFTSFELIFGSLLFISFLMISPVLGLYPIMLAGGPLLLLSFIIDLAGIATGIAMGVRRYALRNIARESDRRNVTTAMDASALIIGPAIAAFGFAATMIIAAFSGLSLTTPLILYVLGTLLISGACIGAVKGYYQGIAELAPVVPVNEGALLPAEGGMPMPSYGALSHSSTSSQPIELQDVKASSPLADRMRLLPVRTSNGSELEENAADYYMSLPSPSLSTSSPSEKK